MKKILLIGKNSRLCKLYIKKSKLKNFDTYTHNQINFIKYKKYSHLINFSFNPKLFKNKYNKKFDIDIHLSKKAKEHNLYYIFFSTRYVYSQFNKFPAKELIKKLKPKNIYGKNKLIIENQLKKKLKKKTTSFKTWYFSFF